ncbi:sel1 repeat family protein [Nocardioides mangrovicus]|uniref:Sel1 repeat family protein n=1 Tax=Nocardioides mangrovicus TaxID=2478913 RepID=A0A3L8NY08_9ACTN|nr:sel1 repeat family protein [Nocardioides mangrovicus]
MDWADIDSVRAEWPRAELEPSRDLQQWQRAVAIYEARDDYSSMMQCATMLGNALAHSLYGTGILRGSDLPETAHKVLYCSLCPPPDGQTFADSAQRAARLALTVIRENGWRPPSMGGTEGYFEALIMDRGNRMLLSSAIGPADAPWSGDLRAFFEVPPQPMVGELPPHGQPAGEVVARIAETLRQAEDGDQGSTLYADAMARHAAGDPHGALELYGQAGRLGSVEAMAAAGDLASDLGRTEESDFWYETAASAGHTVSMFNTGAAAYRRQDLATAMQWFQRSAEAGNVEGYAALTQLSSEAGDERSEAYWARLGAEAGHTFCMGRHGLLLAREADGDVPTLRRARDVVEQAADRGDIQAATLAVDLNHQLSDAPRAQRFVTMVVQNGDAEANDRLRRFGYL